MFRERDSPSLGPKGNLEKSLLKGGVNLSPADDGVVGGGVAVSTRLPRCVDFHGNVGRFSTFEGMATVYSNNQPTRTNNDIASTERHRFLSDLPLLPLAHRDWTECCCPYCCLMCCLLRGFHEITSPFSQLLNQTYHCSRAKDSTQHYMLLARSSTIELEPPLWNLVHVNTRTHLIIVG